MHSLRSRVEISEHYRYMFTPTQEIVKRSSRPTPSPSNIAIWKITQELPQELS